MSKRECTESRIRWFHCSKTWSSRRNFCINLQMINATKFLWSCEKSKKYSSTFKNLQSAKNIKKFTRCLRKFPRQKITRTRQHTNISLSHSLLHFIHSEHASPSWCSREHFLFDFELLHDVRRFCFLYLSRDSKSKRKGDVEMKKKLYTPIEFAAVDFSTCCCCRRFLVDSTERRVCRVYFSVIQSEGIFKQQSWLAPLSPSLSRATKYIVGSEPLRYRN